MLAGYSAAEVLGASCAPADGRRGHAARWPTASRGLRVHAACSSPRRDHGGGSEAVATSPIGLALVALVASDLAGAVAHGDGRGSHSYSTVCPRPCRSSRCAGLGTATTSTSPTRATRSRSSTTAVATEYRSKPGGTWSARTAFRSSTGPSSGRVARPCSRPGSSPWTSTASSNGAERLGLPDDRRDRACAHAPCHVPATCGCSRSGAAGPAARAVAATRRRARRRDRPVRDGVRRHEPAAADRRRAAVGGRRRRRISCWSPARRRSTSSSPCGVGALDGRHPDAGRRAGARIAAALLPAGGCSSTDAMSRRLPADRNLVRENRLPAAPLSARQFGRRELPGHRGHARRSSSFRARLRLARSRPFTPMDRVGERRASPWRAPEDRAPAVRLPAQLARCSSGRAALITPPAASRGRCAACRRRGPCRRSPAPSCREASSIISSPSIAAPRFPPASEV